MAKMGKNNELIIYQFTGNSSFEMIERPRKPSKIANLLPVFFRVAHLCPLSVFPQLQAWSLCFRLSSTSGAHLFGAGRIFTNPSGAQNSGMKHSDVKH